jgi:caffeoyl-CoA O-methyltransferase
MDRDVYAELMTTPVHESLANLAAETEATQTAPQMLTGALAGRFLELLTFATGARRVLEIGTYTGYSALSMAQALPDGAELITCELDPERAEFTRAHLAGAPGGDKVDVRVGPALDTIAGFDPTDPPFDLVFIDADKVGYPAYFDAVLPLLADRGLIVLDNMFRGGSVLEDDPDEGTVAIVELSKRLAADPSLVTVLLPIRDGMTVVRRRSPG